MKSCKKADSYKNLSISALVLCAGQGARTGLNYNKMLHYVGSKTILEMTIERVQASLVKTVMLVISPQDEPAIKEIVKQYKNISVCYGGNTRTESVKKGLNELGYCDIVVIHDGARPYINAEIINASIDSAIDYGSGIVAVPTVDTIKEIRNNDVIRTLSRAGLYNIQTPQTFRYEDICAAYNACAGIFTDDSEVYERAGFTPKIVIGDYKNIKVTTMEDLYRPVSVRSKIGVGFDVHPLVSGRPLILGGVRVPYGKGLSGHSDADVLTHAIMDALLSAAGLPDIGVLFPDKDPKYKNASSIGLLSAVNNNIILRGFRVNNVSAVIMAQKPRLAETIPEMRACLAATLKINIEQINVSATTTEHLGIIGNEKGIAASATCLLNY